MKYQLFLCRVDVFMGLEQGASTCQVAKFLMYLCPQHLCGTERCWRVQGHDGMGEMHQSRLGLSPRGRDGSQLVSASWVRRFYNEITLTKQHLQCQRVDSDIKADSDVSKHTLPQSTNGFWLQLCFQMESKTQMQDLNADPKPPETSGAAGPETDFRALLLPEENQNLGLEICLGEGFCLWDVLIHPLSLAFHPLVLLRSARAPPAGLAWAQGRASSLQPLFSQAAAVSLFLSLGPVTLHMT